MSIDLTYEYVFKRCRDYQQILDFLTGRVMRHAASTSRLDDFTSSRVHVSVPVRLADIEFSLLGRIFVMPGGRPSNMLEPTIFQIPKTLTRFQIQKTRTEFHIPKTENWIPDSKTLKWNLNVISILARATTNDS